jgi:hypothetical protein
LEIFRQLGQHTDTAWPLEGLATVARSQGDYGGSCAQREIAAVLEGLAGLAADQAGPTPRWANRNSRRRGQRATPSRWTKRWTTRWLRTQRLERSEGQFQVQARSGIGEQKKRRRPPITQTWPVPAIRAAQRSHRQGDLGPSGTASS